MLSRGYVILKPAIVIGEQPIVRIMAIHCDEADYIEWAKSKTMKGHDYLIPDFFVTEYLYLKGITTTVEELMGGGELSTTEKVTAALLIEKTGEGYSRFFLIGRIKTILKEYKLPYEEFINAYCEHLKSI